MSLSRTPRKNRRNFVFHGATCMFPGALHGEMITGDNWEAELDSLDMVAADFPAQSGQFFTINLPQPSVPAQLQTPQFRPTQHHGHGTSMWGPRCPPPNVASYELDYNRFWSGPMDLTRPPQKEAMDLTVDRQPPTLSPQAPTLSRQSTPTITQLKRPTITDRPQPPNSPDSPQPPQLSPQSKAEADHKYLTAMLEQEHLLPKAVESIKASTQEYRPIAAKKAAVKLTTNVSASMEDAEPAVSAKASLLAASTKKTVPKTAEGPTVAKKAAVKVPPSKVSSSMEAARGLNKKPYSCDICNQSFTQLASQKRHIKQKQCRLFPCEECAMSFKTESDQIKHITNTHQTERTGWHGDWFNCGTCNEWIKTRTNFKRHLIRKHSGKCNTCRPGKVCDKCPHVKCEKCSRKFKSKDSLKKHQKDKGHDEIPTEPIANLE